MRHCLDSARERDERLLHGPIQAFRPLVAHSQVQAVLRPSVPDSDAMEDYREARRQDRAFALDPAAAGKDTDLKARLRHRVSALEGLLNEWRASAGLERCNVLSHHGALNLAIV